MVAVTQVTEVIQKTINFPYEGDKKNSLENSATKVTVVTNNAGADSSKVTELTGNSGMSIKSN